MKTCGLKYLLLNTKKVILIFLIIYSSLFITNYSLVNAQWLQYSLPYDGIAYTLGFYNVNIGVSCGHTFSPFNEKIYYTTNSGVIWNLANYPQELRSLPGIQFINATTVYAGGAENIFIGKYCDVKNDFILYPKKIRERLLTEGKREFVREYKAAFVKSTNAGINWQKVGQFDTLSGYINDIFFFDVNTGYALIDISPYHNTGFYKTTNAGTNWQFIKLIESNSIVEKIIFFDMNTGIAKGFNYGGRIYKTTNGGVNWNTTSMPTQIDGITFFNSTTGIAIGINDSISTNYIYKTTNTGNNWNLISTISGLRLFTNLESIASTGTAFAVGNVIDSNLIPAKITTIKTTNYGVNWVLKEFNPTLLTYGLALTDQNNFFIGCGDFNLPAKILKSTNGGNVFVNLISSRIPEAFLLEQNYPNPFNPSTNIKYQIANNSFIALKVYDIPGKEIITLVNEKLKPGVYETTFNGSGLPSGIYFYSLFADGERMDTKKMLFIK